MSSMLKGMTGRDIKLGLSLVKLFLARCLYWGSTLDDPQQQTGFAL